ncbi:BRO1-like domain-containing protein [Pilaira anomala]|nr:BRO1-like domain-containing protein [Pilaira anomala]
MATPQIPFISAPFKKTDDVDWVHPLKKYIARFYQDDPEKYKEETQSFNRLRQDIRGAGKDMTGRDLLYRYFGQLELLDLRFPVDEKHVKVLFNWYDAFNNRAISQYSLAFEKASIIFNEAATLSAIASGQNRAETEGRKKAFHYFQASAGMFQYINDNFLHAPSEDLSRETVNVLSELMLVQAQECFLESSVREKTKDGLIAKLASHAAWVYGNLVDSLGDAVSRGVGIDKSWILLCQIKQKFYSATAQVHKAAAACEHEAKYGEAVGRYGAAESAAKEAVKLASGFMNVLTGSNYGHGTIPTEAGHAMQELCKNLAASCTEKLVAMTRDNDMIYHENVPQESILTPIDRLKAVKSIPIVELYGPEEMKKVIGADLFQKLIPISVHESASLYSEEKAKLVRLENERCDIAKAELNASLDYMKLPSSLSKFKNQNHHATSFNHFASPPPPPSEIQSLADQVMAEERRVPITELFNTLTSLRNRARQRLDEASLNLDKEMRECEQGRVKYADLWTQPPSGPLTTEFRHDINNHRHTLDGASQSDNQLLSRYESVRRNIEILKNGGQSRELERAYTECISVLAQDNNNKNENTGMNLLDIDVTEKSKSNDVLIEKVQRVESILEKLRKIEQDRDDTFRDLKDKTKLDDISQLLILNKKANVEQQIFASELEKFRPHQQRISATIQHQQQAIQDLTVAFKRLMEGDEAQNLQSQHDKADRLVRNLNEDLKEAKSTYFEIREGLTRGTQFYSGLQDTVDALIRNISRFISERSIERNRLMDDIESQKSTREQELLRESLNKYSSAPPPPTTTTTTSSVPQLTHLTRQLSLTEPSAPYTGYTPAPPPKPQAFQPQQQPPPPPSPYGMYGAAAASSSSPSTVSTPSYQQQPYTAQPYATPLQQQPPSPYNQGFQPQQQYTRPAYNQPNYQPQYQQPPHQGPPPPHHQGPPPPSHQGPQGYYGHMAPAPAPQNQYRPHQGSGMMPPPPPQGYPPQAPYQPQPWQQQQQQQQWQQPPYQQRPPPSSNGSGNLLD